jgi:hypothetical protein
MKKEAYEDSAIEYTAKRLRHLQRDCTLANPEVMKTCVARSFWLAYLREIICSFV